MTFTKVVAFDLYGTLLDTSSISKKLAEYLPESADAANITSEWRKYQLEYSWRITAMGVYENFEKITRLSLEHAASEAGYPLKENTVEEIIKAYDRLTVFQDVPSTLEKLNNSPLISTVIFSNGTDKMVGNSIKNCAELKHFSDSVLPFITVDTVKAFKPSPTVYQHLAKTVLKEDKRNEIWLISGNPFDIVGAREAGWNAIWVDRAGKGWVDKLGYPTRIIGNLEEIVDIIHKV